MSHNAIGGPIETGAGTTAEKTTTTGKKLWPLEDVGTVVPIVPTRAPPVPITGIVGSIAESRDSRPFAWTKASEDWLIFHSEGVHFQHLGQMVGSLHFGHLALDVNLIHFLKETTAPCNDIIQGFGDIDAQANVQNNSSMQFSTQCRKAVRDRGDLLHDWSKSLTQQVQEVIAVFANSKRVWDRSQQLISGHSQP